MTAAREPLSHDSSQNLRPSPPHVQSNSPQFKQCLDRYWRLNIAVMSILLVIWALVSLGCGVIFADTLNQFKFFRSGIPLGFWFAQQGSIIVFVLLILFYCLLMNHLDRRHHRELQALRQERS